MWKYLKHQNILPLIGVSTSTIQLISKWMPGGNLSEYIGEHPEAGRVRLVGVILFMIIPRSTQATSYSKLQRASPTSMPARWYTGILRECVIIHRLVSPPC